MYHSQSGLTDLKEKFNILANTLICFLAES